MRRLAIALLATAAMSMPALAQSKMNAPADQQHQQSQVQGQQQPAQQPQAKNTQDQSGSQNGNQQQANSNQDQNANQQQAQNQPIQPQDLSRSEIRQVQSALDKNGDNVGRVDGRWGPKTKDALDKFQQSKGIQANGQLDQQTVADLGLNTNQFEQQGSNSQQK